MRLFISAISWRCVATISSAKARTRGSSRLAALTCEYGYRMMRDHRLHPVELIDRRLRANHVERARKDDTRHGENGDIDGLVSIHVQHEEQHHDGHRRSHDQRHIGTGFAPVEVIGGIGVEVHQPVHDHGGRADHGRKSQVFDHDQSSRRASVVPAKLVALLLPRGISSSSKQPSFGELIERTQVPNTHMPTRMD